MESLGSKTSPTDMVLSAKVAEELAQTWQPAGVQPAGPSLPPWLSPLCPASSRLTTPPSRASGGTCLQEADCAGQDAATAQDSRGPVCYLRTV